MPWATGFAGGISNVLYQWYELGQAAVRPARAAAHSCLLFFNNPFNPLTHTTVGRGAAAACEVFERTTRRYRKPAFGITATRLAGHTVAVHETCIWERAFCRLLHFQKIGGETPVRRQPRVLLVAPMSGHFATLLRGTVAALLPDHDVYITEWADARDVSLSRGSFGLDDYIDYMIEIFRLFEGDVHVIAVCQPSVPVLAAVSLLEADDDPASPASMVLMGGPIDTRISPTAVNRLAEERGTNWFRRNAISRVPWPNPGFGRLVYPGFLQLTGFMTMNLDRHVRAHKKLFHHLVRGDGESADKHKDFYDEYLAVMDLTAEFYLQTVDAVFVRHTLARGGMRHRGRRVEPGLIRRTALLTIEGELDDITGKGQCAAAIDLCSGLDARMKQHYEQPSVGHYGIFNGSRFRSDIVARIAAFTRAHDRPAARDPAIPRRFSEVNGARHAAWMPERHGPGRRSLTGRSSGRALRRSVSAKTAKHH